MKRFTFLLVLVALLAGAASAAFASESTLPPFKRMAPQRMELWQHGSPYWWKMLNLAAADTDAVLSLGACDSAAATTISTGFTAWTTTRNLTLTVSALGSSDNDIDAVQCVVTGTNALGAAITETFTAFTNNTEGTVTGSTAFASITSIDIPAMAGDSIAVSIGIGNKIGAPFTSAFDDNYIKAWVGGATETTGPTVEYSATDIELNTYDFNTDPDGSKDYDVLMFIPPYSSTSAASKW